MAISVSVPLETAISPRPEGHYWVRWGILGRWDVLYWHDGYFWDHGDAGYKAEIFIIGPRVFPPDAQ